jgi:hypothetical protein
MTRRLSLFLLAAVPALVAAERPFHIAIQGARPLRQAGWGLREQLHWRVTFEEAPVLASAELDSTIAPNGRAVYFRRATPLFFDAVVSATPATREAKQRVMDALLAAYNRGASTSYRYVISGDFIHIVPDRAPAPDGSLHSVPSMLDTPVSITRGTYGLGQLVAMVFQQVSKGIGIPIVDGTVPMNVVVHSQVTEEAHGEPAREVLIRAFEEIEGPRLAWHAGRVRLTWDVAYDPTDRYYMYNINSVFEESESSPAPAYRKPK